MHAVSKRSNTILNTDKFCVCVGWSADGMIMVYNAPNKHYNMFVGILCSNLIITLKTYRYFKHQDNRSVSLDQSVVTNPKCLQVRKGLKFGKERKYLYCSTPDVKKAVVKQPLDTKC